jgi:hypothetical protein
MVLLNQTAGDSESEVQVVHFFSWSQGCPDYKAVIDGNVYYVQE